MFLLIAYKTSANSRRAQDNRSPHNHDKTPGNKIPSIFSSAPDGYAKRPNIHTILH